MELINNILNTLNGWLYGYILIILLLASGLYFTLRTRFVQIRYIPEAIGHLTKKNTNKDTLSPFQALMISTASHVGVGNIAGVATAIATGGSGAVFWMWVTAILGASSSFVESTLAQVYKVKDNAGCFRGGPAHYIERALKNRTLAVLFSIMLVACFAFGFNPLQANNITSAIEIYFGGSYSNPVIPAIVGLVLALLSAYVIFGGQKKIVFMTSVMVPVMAIIYLALGLVIIVLNISALPSVIADIFKSAFDFKAILGGFSGSAIMMGIKRGLFSNEAGLGSAPNAAASADVTHPAKQGMAQMLSVFIDTLLICSASAFIILLSGVDTIGLKAMPLVQTAISSQFGQFGIFIITLSVFFFAFSSIVGNYFYTEANIFFIFKKDVSLTVYRWFAVLAVFLGSIAGYDLVWNMADLLMGLMALLNIVSILTLGGIAIKVMNDYARQKKEGKDPTFVASKVGITNCDLWKEDKEN